MTAGKKAFPAAAETSGSALEATPQKRQYQVGSKAEEKKILCFKVTQGLGPELEAKATELSQKAGRKVWPAHIVESAVKAFLAEGQQRQLALLDGKIGVRKA